MVTSEDAIAVETNGGVVGAVAVGNGGVTETVRAAAAFVGNEKTKDTIERNGVRKKAMKMPKKNKVSVSKVVSAADDDDDEMTAAAVVKSGGGARGCRIQVSNTKKPLIFYLNLAKRYIKHNNYVELCALGLAIPTVVTIAEILKKDGWATEKDVTISSVPLKDDAKGRVLLKAKMGILLEKTKKLEKDELVAAKGPSEMCENETKELSFEISGKVFEKNDLQQFDTNGMLIEKNDSENRRTELIEGK